MELPIIIFHCTCVCLWQLQERLEAKKQKIWQKTTPAARMAQEAAVKRAADMQEIDCQARDDAALTEQDDQFTLTVTRSNLSTVEFLSTCLIAVHVIHFW